MNTREFVRSARSAKLSVTFAGTLTLLPAGAAFAQEGTSTTRPTQPSTVAQPNPEVVPTSVPSSSSSGPSGGIERIVITANKREEDVQQVPSSVSAIDDTLLDSLHATQLTDFAPYVPGFTVNSLGTPGQATIALRGLAPISGGSTVATYINEVPTGSSSIFQRAIAFQPDLLPYDIRRVELLRGPQGTLYGANSVGGLLKYVTFDPSLTTPEFSSHVGGGVYGMGGAGQPGWDAHANVDLPLVKERLGLRASYAYNEIPGYVTNVVNGSHGINDATQQSALLALLWQPADRVSLRFSALGQRVQSGDNAIVYLDPRTRRPTYGDLNNAVFVDEPFKKTIGLLSATLNVDFGWADFTSATGYSNTRTKQRTDATLPFGQAPLLLGGTTTGISGFDLDLNLDKVSEEARFTSKPDGRFLWQVGFFYTFERASNNEFVFVRQRDNTPFTGPLAAVNPLADLSLPTTYTEYAGFANASYHFNDYLSLGAGLRFSRNEQDFSQNVNGGILQPLGKTPGNSSENVLDFMVTPQLQLTKDKQIYVRIASGYEPGGPNIALPGVPPQVGATTAISYEGGLKSEFFDRRLLLNIAGYHVDLSNIQVSSVVNNIGVLVNGGNATSNGLEFTAEYQPITGLRLGVNGAYTHATLSDDAPSLGGRAGDRLPYIPEFSGSLTVDYFHALPMLRGDWTGHLGLGFRYVGGSFSEVRSSPRAYRQDSYGALDLNADLSNRNWTIRLFAKNVSDERVYQTITPITDLSGNVDHLRGVPLQPRTVGVEVDFRF